MDTNKSVIEEITNRINTLESNMDAIKSDVTRLDILINGSTTYGSAGIRSDMSEIRGDMNRLRDDVAIAASDVRLILNLLEKLSENHQI